jgi:hypothetical protein
MQAIEEGEKIPKNVKRYEWLFLTIVRAYSTLPMLL